MPPTRQPGNWTSQIFDRAELRMNHWIVVWNSRNDYHDRDPSQTQALCWKHDESSSSIASQLLLQMKFESRSRSHSPGCSLSGSLSHAVQSLGSARWQLEVFRPFMPPRRARATRVPGLLWKKFVLMKNIYELTVWIYLSELFQIEMFFCYFKYLYFCSKLILSYWKI